MRVNFPHLFVLSLTLSCSVVSSRSTPTKTVATQGADAGSGMSPSSPSPAPAPQSAPNPTTNVPKPEVIPTPGTGTNSSTSSQTATSTSTSSQTATSTSTSTQTNTATNTNSSTATGTSTGTASQTGTGTSVVTTLKARSCTNKIDGVDNFCTEYELDDVMADDIKGSCVASENNSAASSYVWADQGCSAVAKTYDRCQIPGNDKTLSVTLFNIFGAADCAKEGGTFTAGTSTPQLPTRVGSCRYFVESVEVTCVEYQSTVLVLDAVAKDCTAPNMYAEQPCSDAMKALDWCEINSMSKQYGGVTVESCADLGGVFHARTMP